MSTTRQYEITYIVDPSLADEARAEIDRAIDATVQEHGTISQNTEAVRRRLAYPLKKQHVGFLRTLQAELPTEQISDLEQSVRKMKGVLRTTVIQTSARAAVMATIFDNVKQRDQQGRAEPAAATPAAKPRQEVTMAEVEEKIAQALEEEVK